MRQLLPARLSKRLQYAADVVKNTKHIRIVSHHDADGVCAAAILTRTAMRLGHEFCTTLFNEFDDCMRRLRSEENDLVLMADMGSGQIADVENLGTPTVVIDHHDMMRDSNEVHHINPRVFDIDGTSDASASTMAFLLSLFVDERNWDLAYLFVAGCIGDRQSCPAMTGLNKRIVEEAIKRGALESRRDLKIEGNELKAAIAKMCDPYVLGLTGDQEGVLRFLKDLGIAADKRIADLSLREKLKLRSGIVLKLLAQGAHAEAACSIVVDRYYSPGWKTSANEIAAIANACGRTNNAPVALAACLGDSKALETAQKIRHNYIVDIIESMKRVLEAGAFKMENVQFMYIDTPRLSGTIAGLCMLYLFDQSMPTVSLAVDGKKTKVSARGTKRLVASGLNLAVACRDAAQHVGGHGGGHDIAAGATIPKGREEEFLKQINEIIGRQLGSTKTGNAAVGK